MATAAVECLVLVDLQAAFVTGSDAVSDAIVLLAAATDLLDRARQARSLIIHLQNDGAPGAEDEPGTPGWALCIEPGSGETVRGHRSRGDPGRQGHPPPGDHGRDVRDVRQRDRPVGP
jgi:streptothricin hydrolase